MATIVFFLVYSQPYLSYPPAFFYRRTAIVVDMEESEIKSAEGFNTAVGAAIRAAAAFDGKSVRQLSRDTGIEYVTLGRYLKGIRDIPVPVLYRCCQHLNTDITTIINDAYRGLRRDIPDAGV